MAILRSNRSKRLQRAAPALQHNNRHGSSYYLPSSSSSSHTSSSPPALTPDSHSEDEEFGGHDYPTVYKSKDYNSSIYNEDCTDEEGGRHTDEYSSEADGPSGDTDEYSSEVDEPSSEADEYSSEADKYFSEADEYSNEDNEYYNRSDAICEHHKEKRRVHSENEYGKCKTKRFMDSVRMGRGTVIKDMRMERKGSIERAKYKVR